jgi:cell division protein FtsQ
MTPEPYANAPELDLEELALPRQQNSPGSGKARRANRKHRWRKLLGWLGTLAALGGAIFLVVRFGRVDPRFRLRAVRVQGGKYVTTAEIDEKFAADKDQSILRVPLEQRRREIEKIPWVRTATLRRVLTGDLEVMVRERTPVAFVSKPDGLALVDGEGVILDAPRDSSFHFPVVHGLTEREPDAARREKMRLFDALMKDLERGGLQSSDVISEVDLRDAQDARLIVTDSSGALVLHLGKENFLGRYLIYLGHVDEWKQKLPNIHSIDLRYEGQVVINADSQRDWKAQRTRAGPSELPAAAPKGTPNAGAKPGPVAAAHPASLTSRKTQ